MNIPYWCITAHFAYFFREILGIKKYQKNDSGRSESLVAGCRIAGCKNY